MRQRFDHYLMTGELPDGAEGDSGDVIVHHNNQNMIQAELAQVERIVPDGGG